MVACAANEFETIGHIVDDRDKPAAFLLPVEDVNAVAGIGFPDVEHEKALVEAGFRLETALGPCPVCEYQLVARLRVTEFVVENLMEFQGRRGFFTARRGRIPAVIEPFSGPCDLRMPDPAEGILKGFVLHEVVQEDGAPVRAVFPSFVRKVPLTCGKGKLPERVPGFAGERVGIGDRFFGASVQALAHEYVVVLQSGIFQEIQELALLLEIVLPFEVPQLSDPLLYRFPEGDAGQVVLGQFSLFQKPFLENGGFLRFHPAVGVGYGGAMQGVGKKGVAEGLGEGEPDGFEQVLRIPGAA